jgi:hypothetical protein
MPCPSHLLDLSILITYIPLQKHIMQAGSSGIAFHLHWGSARF